MENPKETNGEQVPELSAQKRMEKFYILNHENSGRSAVFKVWHPKRV
jgi:hypothetical protein